MAGAPTGPLGAGLDNLLEGCQIIDHDFRCVYLNGAALRHARRPREALLGRTLGEAYPGIEDSETFGVLRTCMEDRRARHLVNAFRFPDGEIRWFEIRFEPVAAGLAVLSLDTTEQHRARRDRELMLGLMERLAAESGLDALSTGVAAWMARALDIEQVEIRARRVGREVCEHRGGLPAGASCRASTVWSGTPTRAHVPLCTGGRCEGGLLLRDRRSAHLGKDTISRLEALAEPLAAALARERAREELAASEVRFRRLLGSVSDVVWAARPDGSELFYVSPNIAQVYGHPASDFEADPGLWAKLVHPEDRARVAGHTAVLRAEGVVNDVYRIVRPDGSVRWLRDHKALIRDDATGEALQMGGTATDITDEVLARQAVADRKQALVESRQRLQRLNEVVQELAGARCDASILGIARDAARALTGASGAAILLRQGEVLACMAAAGTCPFQVGDTRPVGEDSLHGHAVATGRLESVVDVATDPRTRDAAAAHPGIGSLAVAPVPGGETGGAIGVYWDRPRALRPDDTWVLQVLAGSVSLTRANLRTFQALEDSQRRNRAVYEHLPDATLVFRRGSRGFVLAEVNEEARRLADGALERFLGAGPEVVAEALPGLAEDMAEAEQRQTTVARELESILPGPGGPRHLILTSRYIPRDLLLVHIRDLTEQRRTEDQLRVSQRLEAVGRLAGGVAHDFNNLLSVILTHAAFIEEELRDGDPLHDDVVQVQEAGRRAAALTRQLLAFSRKQVLVPEVLSLNRVVRGIERMLRRLIGEDIELVVRCDEHLGNTLADPGQVDQVLMNLVVNARDAMPTGGRLVIETANVGPGEGDPQPWVMLAVTDMGKGMDEGVRERIFEPFFTTKEKARGTGLGLATVHGIVSQSGGRVLVHSQPGAGARFEVFLPRVEAEVVDQAAPATRPTRGRGRILVVEDEAAIRRVTARILRRAGYTVLTAADGATALALAAEEEELDLFITDVVMPGLSGPETVERLRQTRPVLPVLFMSGYTDDAIERHGALGSDIPLLPKPFTPAELTRRVHEVIAAGSRPGIG